MKNILSVLLIIPMMILWSCSDESTDIEPVVQGTEITEFSFLKSSNPRSDLGLSYCNIENDIISGRLPLELILKIWLQVLNIMARKFWSITIGKLAVNCK